MTMLVHRRLIAEAGLTSYPTVWSSHLESYAAAPRRSADGVRTGYDIELLGTALPADVRTHLRTDPDLDVGTYDAYYGGLRAMMPWLAARPGRPAASR